MLKSFDNKGEKIGMKLHIIFLTVNIIWMYNKFIVKSGLPLSHIVGQMDLSLNQNDDLAKSQFENQNYIDFAGQVKTFS